MPQHVRQLHRLVVVGGERVGKTAIIEQLLFGNHVVGQGGLPTTGDIYEVALETEKGIVERLQIFDTPGSLFAPSKSTKSISEQEHFMSIADGVLLVYEITSKASFELIMSARQKIALRNKDLPMVLLGNKSDLNAIREVDTIRSQTWARSHGIRPYEVTVISRDSLKDPFCYITWRMANPVSQRASSKWDTDTNHSSLTTQPLSKEPVQHLYGFIMKYMGCPDYRGCDLVPVVFDL